MRKLNPVELKPWTLPLVVLALVLPIVTATLLVGAVGAFVAGAVIAAALLVIAARTQYDEEIEVAAPSDERYHVLVVATEAVEKPDQIEAIANSARRGAEALGPGRGGPEVLVLAPALNRGMAHWTSDLREARLAAQRRLAVSLAGLAAAELDARGRVGDTDPVQAIEDALRSYSAHEVLFVTPKGEGEELVMEVRRRLDRPVRHLDRRPASSPIASRR
jgi:hypothetical protein